jgi:hypothetical protein
MSLRTTLSMTIHSQTSSCTRPRTSFTTASDGRSGSARRAPRNGCSTSSSGSARPSRTHARRYARIVARARNPAERRALAAEYGSKRWTSAERVDPAEVASIIAEAASARNGWKVILARCARTRKPRSALQLAREMIARLRPRVPMAASSTTSDDPIRPAVRRGSPTDPSSRARPDHPG